MVRVSSPAKLRPWSELIAKVMMGVVPGLVNYRQRKNYFLNNLAFHSRYRYRQKLFWNYFLVADAETAVLFSLEGGSVADKVISEIICRSQQIQIQVNIIFELFPL